VDRAIDVAFGGKVNDCARLRFLEEIEDELAVGDVALNERIIAMVGDRLEIGKVTRVGQLVEVEERGAFLLKPAQDEV
jgi:hypothetical protein